MSAKTFSFPGKRAQRSIRIQSPWRMGAGSSRETSKCGSPLLPLQPTIGGSVYVKPQDIDWQPTQFAGISIKVLYEDKAKGETTCLLKWAPGATTSRSAPLSLLAPDVTDGPT